MAVSMGIRNRRSMLHIDLGGVYSVEHPTIPNSILDKTKSKVHALSPSGTKATISSLQFPLSYQMFQAFLLAIRFPLVLASGFGDEVTNNLITDIAPLLALFGERVAQQFMSQSVGTADNIIFAVAPLGIVTAIVGAIRVGGSRSLRAIIGRARERRAAVEIELMSSTSTDVCEVWDGSAVVRALGESPIIELIYVVPNASDGSESSPLLMKWEDDAGIYDFESAKRLPRSHGLLKKVWSSHSENTNVQDRAIVSAPNISLNIATMGSHFELCCIAAFGMLLQSSVIVYAVLINFNFLPSLGSRLQKTEYPAIIYAPLMACGTAVLVIGIIANGYELDWMAKTIKGCTTWSVVTWGFDQPIPSNDLRAANILTARQRLGALTQWPSQWQMIVNSTVEAIAASMNFLFSSPDIILNRNDWSARDHFDWSMTVELEAGSEDGRCLGEIFLSLKRSKLVDGPWGPWVVLDTEIEALIGLWMLHFHNLQRPTQQNDTVDEINGSGLRVGSGSHSSEPILRVLGLNDELARMDYDRWILRQTHPVIVENLDDFTGGSNKRCNYVIGNPTDNNLGQGVSVMGVITGSPLERLCGQSIYAGFISKISEHVEIGGKVEIRCGNSGAKDSFGLLCPGLVGLAEIIGQAGLASTEEAYMSIIPVLSGLERLPIGAGHTQVLLDIVEAANSMTRQNRREDSDSFLLWLFHTAESATNVYKARKQWRDAGRIYSDLRSACDKIEHSLAMDYIDQAERRISRFCEIVCTVITIDSNSQYDALESVNRWMIELFGTSAVITLGKCKQADNEVLLAIESSSKDEQLRQAVSDGRGIRAGQLLADGANIDGNSEGNQQTPLILACIAGYLVVTEYLLLMGAKSTGQDYYGRTALHYAAEKGHISIVELLLPCDGSTVNILDKQGRSSLDLAIAMIVGEVVKLLLFNGANDINGQGRTLLGEMQSSGAGPDISSANIGSQRTPVHWAVWIRSNRTLRGMLDNTVDIEQTDKLGLTALTYCGHERFADGEGKTPLHHAATAGHETIVDLLLRRGADIKANDVYEGIPLHGTVNRGHQRTLQLFLHEGADTETKYIDGETLLHKAAREGHYSTTRLLLSRKTDVDSRNNNNETPLHQAARAGHEAIVTLLLNSGANLEAKNGLGEHRLHSAASSGYKRVVRLLLDKGANDGATDDHGETVLHKATNGGYEPILRLLFDRQTDCRAIYPDGETHLHKATRAGHHRIVGLLLNMGLDCETKFIGGTTLLGVAARQGHWETVQLLLDRGASKEVRDYEWMTPLHGAAQEGHTRTVEVLLVHGARIETREGQRYTPLHSAVEKRHMATVELLLDYGATGVPRDVYTEMPIHTAVSNGDTAIVQLLLDYGVNREATNLFGDRPIHFAAERGHYAIMQLLLDRGVGIEARNHSGNRPIHLAAEGGHSAVMQLLLDRGASASMCGTVGWPIHLAIYNGHQSAVELLLDQGVDVHVRDRDWNLPLQEAVRRGYGGIVAQLLDHGADINAKDDYAR
ncbi:hypothetical protein Q9L58_006877 [Maublancomyces gigas]|uniref:Uncharacterized protein n=1 Tax=Discina gigas TaxID=1032678 RepID=A0ABR3GED5_9PEZI